MTDEKPERIAGEIFDMLGGELKVVGNNLDKMDFGASVPFNPKRYHIGHHVESPNWGSFWIKRDDPIRSCDIRQEIRIFLENFSALDHLRDVRKPTLTYCMVNYLEIGVTPKASTKYLAHIQLFEKSGE